MTARGLSFQGFVDLQVNGFTGVDFSNPGLTEDSFRFACEELLKKGTAAFLPTVITSPRNVYKRNLRIISSVMGRDEFSMRLPGIHVEGPFISKKQGAVGAHNPEYVRNVDVDFLKRLNEWADGRISLLTIAVELEGALELALEAEKMGIVVSAGHSLAGEEELEKAVEAGVKAFTHLGNGLPNMIHRHNNPIWAALANDSLKIMIIADGHHLPNPILKTMIHAKGVERTIVVSDASPLAGMKPGRYETLGNSVILEESGLLHNPEKKCLVGSSATIIQCMNHLASLGFLDLEDLLKLGLHNPLELIGLSVDDLKAESDVRYDPGNKVFTVKE